MINNFLQIGKSANGKESLEAFISDVTQHSELFNFSEILEMENL